MSRAIRLSFLFFLSSVSIAAAKGPAASPGWAYVHVDSRTEFGFAPNLGMSFNSNDSSSGAITSSVSGGTHLVFLRGITEATTSGFVGGVAHVSAYGEGYCNIANWHPVGVSDVRGPGTELTVNCFKDSGTPASTGYVLTFSNDRNPGAAGKLAWLYADGAGPLNPDWNYSSTGRGNTISQLGPGVYTVDLAGVDLFRGTAQATAYGSDNGYCNLGSWGMRVPSTAVEVRCFNYQGVLQDHAFTLSYAADVSLLGAAPSRTAHAFISDGFAVVPRLGEAAHQDNSTGFANTLVRLGSPRGSTYVGSYGLDVPVIPPPGEGAFLGLPIAVAFGSNAHCRPVGFLFNIAMGRVGTWVFCTTPGGLESDSAFVVQVVGR